VQLELEDYLRCGRLEHGFERLHRTAAERLNSRQRLLELAEKGVYSSYAHLSVASSAKQMRQIALFSIFAIAINSRSLARFLR
jgi:hypothetical protein